MAQRRSTLRTGVVVAAGAALLVGATAQIAGAQDAKDLYAKNCVSCHGAAGKGDGPAGKMLKPPPGDFATTLKDKSEADVATMIKEGKKHAAVKKMTDEQITGLAKYAKELSAK